MPAVIALLLLFALDSISQALLPDVLVLQTQRCFVSVHTCQEKTRVCCNGQPRLMMGGCGTVDKEGFRTATWFHIRVYRKIHYHNQLIVGKKVGLIVANRTHLSLACRKCSTSLQHTSVG